MRTVIHLDGWNISVDWGASYYGQSFFIPSVNIKRDARAIRESARAANKPIEITEVTEAGARGLRVWIITGTM